MEKFFIALPYILFFIFAFLLAIPVYSQIQKNTTTENFRLQNSFCILIVFSFVFFWGMRGYLSSDWVQYAPAFKALQPFNFNENILDYNFFIVPWEKGFVLYMTIIRTLTDDYLVFQIISYLIDFFFYYRFFSRNLDKSLLPLACIFFLLFYGEHFSCNFLRNSKAFIIFLYATKYIEKRNFFKYLILMIIGMQFHISVLFLIPFYFVANLQISNKFLLIIFFVGNCIYFFNIEYIKIILGYIASLSDTRISKLIAFYLESEGYNSRVGLSIGFIERFFTFFIILKYKRSLCKKNSSNIIYINALLIYIFLNLYVSEMYVLIERFSILYCFGYWIFYPQIYPKTNKKIFLLILFFYAILKIYSGHRDITFTYENYLLPHRTYSERINFIS